MRMKYMYYLLRENFEALNSFSVETKTEKVGVQNYSIATIKNWLSVKEALINIRKIELYKDFIDDILANPSFIHETDSFNVPMSSYKSISDNYSKMLLQIEGIIDFCEASGFDKTEQGFDVKMPPTDDFDEFSKNIELLNRAISQCPYLNIEKEKIKLKKTDIGSIWFEFFVIATGSSIILSNLAKIVDKCIKIRSHYNTVRQQEEMLRTVKLKNDVLETVLEANKELINKVISDSIAELQNEIPNTKLQAEDIERVKFTLNTIINLMDRGMEIYASIDSPPEVKDLFPTSDEISLLSNTKGLLPESLEDTTK